MALLSSKAVGSIVKFNVGTSAKNFIVVHQGLPGSMYDSSCDGTWLLMEDTYTFQVWDSTDNDYENSNIHSYLNGTFLDLVDSKIKNAIKQVKIPYRKGAGTSKTVTSGSSGLSTKVFLLSFDEIGFSRTSYEYSSYVQYIPQDGVALDYFGDDTTRRSLYNGDYDGWKLRTPYCTGSNTVCAVMSTGKLTPGAGVTLKGGVRPAMVLPGTLEVDDDDNVIVNTAPVISGSDSALGTYDHTQPSYQYSVTDAEGDAVTVTEAIDGTTIRTFTATLGATNTLTFTDLAWMKILNGSHTLTITATDSGGMSATRTLTLTKNVTSLSFTLETPLDADDMISRAIENITAAIPTGAAITIEVCNNGYDASPTWEDVTENVLAGEKFYIANQTKTADKWGYNVRVTVERGSATGDCYVVSMIGNFE